MTAWFQRSRLGVSGIVAVLLSIAFYTSANDTDKGERLGFVIAERGASVYAIVLSARASPSEQHAANELQHFIKLASGAELEIVDEISPRARQPQRIFVGAGDRLKSVIAGGNPVDWETLGDEGFILRTVAGEGARPDIIVAGGRLRGTMYGIYTLLDRLGFRWYTNRKTWYPAGSILRLPRLDETIAPAFMYREPYISEAFDGDWAARNRVNSHRAGFGDMHGGRMGVQGVHTFRRLIPYALFKEHPEYFPRIGGKRVTGYVQRCLTNPDVVQVAAKNLIKWMDDQPDDMIFSLSQEDSENLCECSPCTKMMEDEGSPAGLYLHFVNRVAAIVERKHPDKYISTLAYWFTEKPPKTVKPRPNVFIRLCPISICVAHPFTECTDPPSVSFHNYLRGWSRITDRIIIWHYNTDFSNLLMPFPNFKEFTSDIKFYDANGVRGIFFQGSAHGPGGGDAELRAWVMARLLWDPHQDADALVDEWLHGVYGRAYEPMRAYYDLMHARIAEPERHLHVFDPPTTEMWPDPVVAQMDRLHEKALKLGAGDETAVFHIKKNRIAVKFLQYVLNTGRLEVDDGAYRPVGNKVTSDDHVRFVEYFKAFKVRQLREEAYDSDFITLLRQRVESHPVISIENEALRLDVVPRLGGRIVRLVYKETGVNLLHTLGPETNYYPVMGGYGESTTRTWGCTGFADPYEAVLNDSRTLTLTAKTGNGLRFQRTVSLAERGPTINFSSAIINDSNSTRTCRLVCSMSLRADPAEVVLKARSTDGRFVEPRPSEAKKHFFRPVMTYRYDGSNRPAGSWRLENVGRGLALQNSFREAEVESCRLVTSKKMKMVRMTIQSAEHEVPPGGKVAIDHTWELIENDQLQSVPPMAERIEK